MNGTESDRMGFVIALIIIIIIIAVLNNALKGDNPRELNTVVKAENTTPQPTQVPVTPKPTAKVAVNYEQDERLEEAIQYALSQVGDQLVYWKAEGNQKFYIQTSTKVVYFWWYEWMYERHGFSAYMNPDGTCRTYEGNWTDVSDVYKYISYYLNQE